MKRIAVFLLLIPLAVFGCGNNTSAQSSGLNEWQKNFLEAEGLPTEYDELTDSQKYSVQRIYEMIDYLNKKYNEEFVYAGYIEK